MHRLTGLALGTLAGLVRGAGSPIRPCGASQRARQHKHCPPSAATHARGSASPQADRTASSCPATARVSLEACAG
jgi:hypothetical protein